jgi:hypothetical protein
MLTHEDDNVKDLLSLRKHTEVFRAKGHNLYNFLFNTKAHVLKY